MVILVGLCRYAFRAIGVEYDCSGLYGMFYFYVHIVYVSFMPLFIFPPDFRFRTGMKKH